MRSRNRSHRKLQALSAIVILSACNGLLDNDPRLLALDDGSGGEAGERAGENDHMAGAGSEAGSTEGGGLNEAGARQAEGGAGATSGAPGVGGEGGSAAQSSGGQTSCVSEPGACMPGEVGMQMEHCGACMTGTRAQTRSCSSSCTWGAWGAWSQCTGVTATCTPGASESRSVGCPCSDTKTQKRTCSSACAWEGWTDTSACDLECCSEIVYCDTPDDISPASRGTWCRKTDPDCSNAQVDSDCLADVDKICGPVVPQLYIQY
jgi:hypothetical protein